MAERAGLFRSRRTWTVARREFFTMVRRPAYLIATLGMPFFFLLIGLVGAIPGYLAMQRASQARAVGVVDGSGRFDFRWVGPHIARDMERIREWWTVQEPDFGLGGRIEQAVATFPAEVIPFADEAAARRAVLEGGIAGYYLVPEDYLESGVVAFYSGKTGFLSGRVLGGGKLVKRALGAGLLEGAVSDRVRARVLETQFTRRFTIEDDGSVTEGSELGRLGTVGVPYGFAVLLLISLMMSGTYLLSGVAEEKENRIMEVLLSSVSPEELLAGKLVGLGGAGLLQLFVWVGIGVAPAAAWLSFVEVRLSTVAASFLYFLLGFLMFGSLMAGFGALGGNLRESQQVATVWSLTCAVPFFFLPLIADEPVGLLARALSYFPLTAPVTMLMRLATNEVPWWEIPLSAAVLAGGIWLALRVSARLFRTGLLLYGKRPTLREILRWARV